MNTSMNNVLLLIITFSFVITNGYTQDPVTITGTSLSMILPDDYTLNENSAIISNEKLSINFMEMPGLDFASQIVDFETIEKDYAEKGIAVLKNIKGKIANYNAQLITVDAKPSLYQIFFGDANFCALANVIANDSIYIIDEASIHTLLNTIEYTKSEISALEEHAQFTFKNQNEDWTFINYQMNAFTFQNETTEDLIMLMQLPPETLGMVTKEDLAKQFQTQFKSQMPNIKTIEEGSWTANNIEGHRVLLDVGEDGNGNLGLLYIFVFSSSKSTFAFQGMGKNNDDATMELLNSFLDNLVLTE